MKSFASDYCCPTHPDVFEAVGNACRNPNDDAYGEDHLTAECVSHLQGYFGKDARVFYVSNGTAANRLALQILLTRPYMSVICADCAHINWAEAGAIESLGYKLHPVPSTNGKITGDMLRAFHDQREDIHQSYPRVISVSNATELGTIYTMDELVAIGEVAGELGFHFHLDGARIANAAVNFELEYVMRLHEWARVDALTLGATKIGGMMGEAVVLWGNELATEAIRLHKQHGQLHSRSHLIAAQVDALYGSTLWLQNAKQSNDMAALLARRCKEEFGWEPVYPVETNAVFMRLEHDLIRSLQEHVPFYVWDEKEGVARWMCSWNMDERDVEEFISVIREAVSYLKEVTS